MKTYIGIDNGVSGSIGIIRPDGSVEYHKTPTKTEQSYTKAKQELSRLDCFAFTELMRSAIQSPNTGEARPVMVLLERPLTSGFAQGNKGKSGIPKMKAILSGHRCLEAQLICLEFLGCPIQYVSSGDWQKELLPSGLKGSAELKKASKDIGTRLFPGLEDQIRRQKDADGLLIAEWGRRKQL